MTRWIPNEVANKAIYAATETAPGVAAVPDYQWLGDLTVTKTQDLRDRQEATGGYDRQVTPVLSLPTFAGTYAEELSFETLPIHMQYALKSGATGTSDGNTVPGYTYAKSPSFAADDIATATLQYGVDGLGFQSVGVRHNEFTVTIDVDDTDGVWKFSSNLFVGSKTALPVVDGVVATATPTTVTMTGAGWTPSAFVGRYYVNAFGTGAGEVRLITANTADTITVDEAFDVTPVAGDVFRVESSMPALTIPDYETIPSYGTKVFIDAAAADIGTTQILDRIISANVTVATNRTSKRFLENDRNTVSKRTGRGGRVITGQLRVEFDRRDEYVKWEQLETFALRIEQEGSVIDGTAGTTKLARLDIPKAAFSTPTEDARENNMTQTIPFRAYLPESEPILTVTAKTALATLP